VHSPRVGHSFIRKPSSNAVGTVLCPSNPHASPEVLQLMRAGRLPEHNQSAVTVSTTCLAVRFPRRPKILQVDGVIFERRRKDARARCAASITGVHEMRDDR